MKKLYLSLLPILLQFLPTFSFKDLSKSPTIAVSLISAAMLSSAVFPHALLLCTELLTHTSSNPPVSYISNARHHLSRHLPGNVSGFRPASVFCFLLQALKMLSQVLNFGLGMCKNFHSLNYSYMDQERRSEKETTYYCLLQHSYSL